MGQCMTSFSCLPEMQEIFEISIKQYTHYVTSNTSRNIMHSSHTAHVRWESSVQGTFCIPPSPGSLCLDTVIVSSHDSDVGPILAGDNLPIRFLFTAVPTTALVVLALFCINWPIGAQIFGHYTKCVFWTRSHCSPTQEDGEYIVTLSKNKWFSFSGEVTYFGFSDNCLRSFP